MAKRPQKGFFPAAGVVLGLGFSLIASAFLGMYLGSYMDKGSSTNIFTPIGLVFGLLVGFHRAWVVIRGLTKRRK